MHKNSSAESRRKLGNLLIAVNVGLLLPVAFYLMSGPTANG
jgi:hypothetical protein